MDFLNGLVGFFRTFGGWALNQLRNIRGWAGGLIAKLASHLGIVRDAFVRAWAHLSLIWKTIAHLHLSTIWATLKKLYDRYNRWMIWWQQHIQAPLDKIRAQLDQIYSRIFAPIIRFLDALRAPLRILALFNRKLAARLDGAIFGLEQKVLGPLLALYQRLNLITSYFRAIITTLGLLDRVLLIESLRRDASIVWAVLTNPGNVLYPKRTPAARPTIRDADADFKVYVATGDGPLADQLAMMDATFEQSKLELA